MPTSAFEIQQSNLRSLLDLLPEDVFECDSISRKFRDTFPKLIDSHGILVEVEAEQRLVFKVGLLGDVQGFGCLGIELLRYLIGRIVEILEKGRLFNISSGHF